MRQRVLYSCGLCCVRVVCICTMFGVVIVLWQWRLPFLHFQFYQERELPAFLFWFTDNSRCCTRTARAVLMWE